MADDKKRILVTYSSGYGATKEIGDVIAKTIQEVRPVEIVVQPIDEIQSIDAFHSVIVGTSVRADHVLANTRDFFQTFQDVLAQKKVAFYLVCLTAGSEDGKQKVMEQYLPQITDAHPAIKMVSINAFGGRIDYRKLNPVMQSLVRRVVEEKTGHPSNGNIDNRDWDQIKKWAVDLANLLA